MLRVKVSSQILEGRELEAAQHVLKFIYTQELPQGDGLVPDGMLLMWMIQVGGRSYISGVLFRKIMQWLAEQSSHPGSKLQPWHPDHVQVHCSFH